MKKREEGKINQQAQRNRHLCMHVNRIKTMKIFSNNNMNVIKLRYDCACPIVIIIFSSNNVNMIISHVPFFVNLLWILPVSWHHSWNVKKHFGGRIGKVRSNFASAAQRIESAHETKMFAFKIDMPTDILRETFEI